MGGVKKKKPWTEQGVGGLYTYCKTGERRGNLETCVGAADINGGHSPHTGGSPSPEWYQGLFPLIVTFTSALW